MAKQTSWLLFSKVHPVLIVLNEDLFPDLIRLEIMGPDLEAANTFGSGHIIINYGIIQHLGAVFL